MLEFLFGFLIATIGVMLSWAIRDECINKFFHGRLYTLIGYTIDDKTVFQERSHLLVHPEKIEGAPGSLWLAHVENNQQDERVVSFEPAPHHTA